MEPVSASMWSLYGIAFALLTSVLPFIMPFILVPLIWHQYLRWKRLNFSLGKIKEAVLFEITLPKEMERPVAAMELVLNMLYQTGVGSPAEAWLDGSIRPWFSLEIASNEGQVKYYLWTWKKYKELVEQVFYAQFPQAVLTLAPDYMKGVFHNPEERTMWATSYKLFSPDAYPIKTYVDYELNKNPDEEVKLDPLVAPVEILGSMQRGERMWLQILIRGHDPQKWDAAELGSWHFFDPAARKEGKWKFSPGSYLDETEDWKKRIDAEIKAIKEGSTRKMVDSTGAEIPSSFISYEPGQDDLIKDMRRHQEKFGYETAIRAIYIGEKDSFNPNNIASMRNMLSGFKRKNGIKPDGATHTDVPDPLKDYARFFPVFRNIIVKRKWKKEIRYLNAFKYRSRYYPPIDGDTYFPSLFVLSVEALATLFHPIGSVAATPTLDRTDSKRSQPPTNLPV